ncbi:uncharacterized protein [Diadema antillarum]|uniref:uncharacterized protein n=1 Tax=Diadema antillarum TaxID=105358 RepID=UPI003A8C2F67
MVDKLSTNGQTTTAASGNTVIIIVGAITGSLLFLVLVMLCIVVGCILRRNSKKSEEDGYGDEKKTKSKKKNPPEYVDRIFRPVDWSNPESPEGNHDIAEIDRILWQESQSRQGSIAMRNPAYKEDDDGDDLFVQQMSNGHAKMNGNGPPRPPNLEMLPSIRRQSAMSDDSSRPRSAKSPSSPTDTQISILDRRTWGTPDLAADIDDNQEDYGGPSSRAIPNTVSGPHNDPEIDYSVFGSGNMRGSALQDNTLRRSFRSRNQAIVDFYESGYSNSIGARSSASLPMSRMDYQIESDERPTSGYGTGSRMLWQKRKFEGFSQ